MGATSHYLEENLNELQDGYMWADCKRCNDQFQTLFVEGSGEPDQEYCDYCQHMLEKGD